MKLRTLLEFTNNLPDDAVENEAGDDFLVWPGRNVMEALAEVIQGLGYECDAPVDLEFRGWELQIRAAGHPISARFSDTGEECYLSLKITRWSACSGTAGQVRPSLNSFTISGTRSRQMRGSRILSGMSSTRAAGRAMPASCRLSNPNAWRSNGGAGGRGA